MTPNEVRQFYAWAASADSRLEPLDDADLHIWAGILRDVPFADAAELIRRLYSTERMLKLQPGTVLEAWQEYSQEMRREITALKRLRSKYGQKVFEIIRREIAETYNRRASQLPGHLIAEHGFTPLPVPPALEASTGEKIPMPETVRRMLTTIGTGSKQ